MYISLDIPEILLGLASVIQYLHFNFVRMGLYKKIRDLEINTGKV